MHEIRFGTDGWRGIIAKDFTFDNVKLVAQAISNYILQINKAENGVVIGYDNRFLSEQFARQVAEVFCGNRIKTYLPPTATPTPVTAFAVKHLGTAGAVMITASHNPPEYNGIKFIPEYAGPALPYVTNVIEDNINKVIEENNFKELNFDKAMAQGQIEIFDPIDSYIEHIGKVINLETIAAAHLKIVIDPMFGAGIRYLDRILEKAGCALEVIHGYRDPLFGGSLPEPTGKSLNELSERMKISGADLGLALDGDADRFGIIDKDGTYIAPNQVLSLVYYHLINNRGMKGPVARSVATTHMLDRIAEKYGYKAEETPVGFKYIGESMLKRGSILGGEESGGLSIAGHIPEKDGILAGLLIAEMTAYEKQTIKELLNKLNELFGNAVSSRIDVHTTPEKKEEVLNVLNELNPAQISGIDVVSSLAIDGKKYILADGSWVLVRASGTEPLFRIYAEADTEDKMKSIQNEMLKLLGL